MIVGNDFCIRNLLLGKNAKGMLRILWLRFANIFIISDKFDVIKA